MRSVFFISLSVAMHATSWLMVAANGQDDPKPAETSSVPVGQEVTIDSVQVRLKNLDENKKLDPVAKAKAIEDCTKALEQLKAAADANARSTQQAKLTREAPDAFQALKVELSKQPSEQPPNVQADATLAQVQQLLSQAEMRLSNAQKSQLSLQDEPKRRADRRLEIPKLADAVKLQIQEIDKLLEAKPATDEPVDVTTATQLQLEARKQAITAEKVASQVELQFYDATGELLSAQRDLAARSVAEAEEQVNALRVIVNERRRQEAEQQVMEARKTSALAHPAVRQIAEVNAELANQRKLLVNRIESTSRELVLTDQQVVDLEVKFKKISKRFDTAGATEAIGLLLRKQRDDLPDIVSHQRKINPRSIEITNTYLEVIDYEEKRNDLATLDQNARDIVKRVDPTTPLSGRDYLEEEVRRVLESQRDVYDSLIADTNSLLDKLVELDVRQRQLISKSAEYAEYCDERILWIRSATVLGASNLRQLRPSLKWLFDLNGWREIGVVLRTDVLAHPLLTFLSALLFLIMILVQRALRTRLMQFGVQACRNNITSYVPTLRALLTTGLLALLWPGVLWHLGHRLVVSESGSEFVSAIGNGLQSMAIVFITMEFFRHVFRHCGLGESHFDWDKETMRLARQTSWWFLACGLPFILIVTITEAQPSEAIKNSLGRIAFVAASLVLTACVHRVMRPVGGVLEKTYLDAPQAWTSRMQNAWHLLAVIAPLTLGLLALAGYYYTALQLAWRLLATWWLVMGLLIVHAALIRWSLLSYRDLAMRQARDRRAAAEATSAAASTSAPTVTTVGKAQSLVKLSDINKQTRKALQLGLFIGLVAGLWLVWGNVLPALGVLRHVEVWHVETTITSGATSTTVSKAITLANVLLAIVVASTTLTASRNLPSLLEIAVLQRLPLDPGVRYAITTVFQYTITAAGIVTAFGMIGIGWSKVQWLVAAISVGLGFGLQEIFANFVSGLILLFERPVRLGDIITVGEITGNVTRIQMRATTITDWDMRELVVPNREFITGRVMNWTLSSTVSRMSITVGVAYGTNPDLVRGLLMKVARRNPLVLKDPEPHSLFNEFGDSTLNFVLRVYMATRDVYLELRHGLLTEIAREFQEAHVKIAFPQQDIHVRSIVPTSAPWGPLIDKPPSASASPNHEASGNPI